MRKSTVINQVEKPKKTKEELYASEIRYRRLFESSKDGILILDAETGKIVDVNPFLIDLLGYSKDEFIKKSIWEIGAFQDIFENKEKFQELQLKEYVRYRDLPLVTSDGHIIHVEFISIVYLVEKNKVIQCSIRDITDQKGKEDTLEKTHRATSDFLNILLNHMHAPIIIWDTSMIIRRFNSKFEQLSGYKMAEVLGKKIDFLFPKEKIETTLELLKVHLDAEHSDVAEIDILTKDSITKTVIWNSSRILDEEGKNIIATISQDITVRRQSELALRKSESHLRALVNTIPDLIWLKDTNGVYLSCNPIFERLFGASVTDIIGKTDYDFVDRELAGFFRENDRKALEAGKPVTNEEWVTFADDGHRAFLETIKSPVFDADGSMVGILGIGRDITERKKTGDALFESEIKYRSFFENSMDAILLTVPDGKILSANQAACNMFGYSEDELINLGRSAIVDTADPRFSVLLDVQRLQGKAQGELTFIRKDRTRFPAEISSAIFKNQEGFELSSMMIRDMTERKRTEIEMIKAKEKAEESDRLKSAFLANMSHEIRTPMNGILGFTELLREPDLSSEQKEKYINIVNQSGQRLLNTVNDLVEISTIEAGVVTVDMKEIDVQVRLNELIQFFNPEATKKGLKLTLENELPKTVAVISTDKTKLDSILTNLIKNAIKFTPSGEIRVGCEVKANNLEFYVKDTGIGIPAARQQAVFDRFVQADIEDTHAFEGSGLGLSIAKAYVEMLGGKIWVKSEPGTGSTFYFTLPLEASKQKKTATEGIATEIPFAKSGAKPKVLIAEDDEVSFQHLSILLKKYTREILHATNGEQAVDICNEQPDIDIILMDIKMPLLHGFDATRRIREFNKEVAIIAQTSYALSGDSEKALEAGCNDYISKPINKKVLLNKIGKLKLKNFTE